MGINSVVIPTSVLSAMCICTKQFQEIPSDYSVSMKILSGNVWRNPKITIHVWSIFAINSFGCDLQYILIVYKKVLEVIWKFHRYQIVKVGSATILPYCKQLGRPAAELPAKCQSSMNILNPILWFQDFILWHRLKWASSLGIINPLWPSDTMSWWHKYQSKFT